MENLRRILLVANDSSEVEELKAIFDQLPPEWKVIFSATPGDALTQLEQVEFDAVFVDLVDGPAAGTQFLQEVWKKQPKPVRFLIGGGLDQQTIVTCVLGANQFLEKPLDLPKLTSALERAQAIDRLVRNKKIQTLVSRMRTFPSRPSLYLEVMRELRSSNASPKTVGDLVGKDLAITTKLLQVVNSAYYGMAQHVSDPADAVLLLGLETTGALVLSIEAFARFDKVKPIYFSVERVWKHSQSVALTAKRIAESVSGDPAIAKDAYTAGLLHDIGKLTLALNFEEQYQGALNLAQKQQLPPWEVETEVFGASHAEVGAYLLALWALPFPIVEAVAAHHLPAKDLEGKFSAATAVHLAEKLENEEKPPAADSPDALKGYDYPAELNLQESIQTFRHMVKSSEPGADSTEFITRKQVQVSTPGGSNGGGQKPPAAVQKMAAQAATSTSRRPTLGWKELNPQARLAIGAAGALLVLVSLGYTLLTAISEPKVKAAAAPAEQVLARASQTPAASRPAAPVPATPIPQKAPPSVELKLQAIMYRGIQSSVIINGKSLRLGEEIDGARVLTIAPEKVVVERAGAQETLQMR